MEEIAAELIPPASLPLNVAAPNRFKINSSEGAIGLLAFKSRLNSFLNVPIFLSIELKRSVQSYGETNLTVGCPAGISRHVGRLLPEI